MSPNCFGEEDDRKRGIGCFCGQSPFILKDIMSKKGRLAFKIYFDELTGEVTEITTSRRFDVEGDLFKLDVLSEACLAMSAYYELEKGLFFGNPTQYGES